MLLESDIVLPSGVWGLKLIPDILMHAGFDSPQVTQLLLSAQSEPTAPWLSGLASRQTDRCLRQGVVLSRRLMSFTGIGSTPYTPRLASI